MAQALRIPPGVVIGESKAKILGQWNKASLIRWQNGRMQPVGGWNRITSAPLASIPRAGVTWLDNQYRRNTAYICDGNVYRERGNVFTDITPAGYLPPNAALYRRGYGMGAYGKGPYGKDTTTGSAKALAHFPTRFGFALWGQQLLFIQSTDSRVFVYDPADDSVAQAAGLPASSQIQDIFVTDERCLVLLGYGGFPNRVAWSQTEDRTNFNFTAVAGTAGYLDLDTAGNLLTARKVQGGYLLFTTTAIYFMRYVGGQFIYSIKRIAEGCSPANPQCVTAYSGKAFWLAKGQFWQYDNGAVAPLPCPVGADLFLNIQSYDTAWAATNYTFPEVWFGYARTGATDGEVTDYVAYNFQDGWWTIGTLGRSFMAGSTVDGFPIAGDKVGNLYQHEQGWLDAGMARLDKCFAEATVSFDDMGGLYTMGVGQVDTGTADPRSIKFDVQARVARNGKSYPKGPYVPRTDGKVSMRFTASDFDFRISGRVDAPWAFGAVLDVAEQRGSR